MSEMIGRLRVALGLETAAFEKGAKRASAEINAFGSKAEIAGYKVGSLIRTLTLGAAAVAGGAFVAGLKQATMAGLDYAANLGEQAAAAGTTTKALQEYRYLATGVGLSAEEMDAAIGRLTRTMGDAAQGGKAQIAVFEKLGIAYRDSNGNVRDAAEVIPDVAEALKKIPDPAQRAAILVDLFGKSGQKLAPLMESGAAGINELRDASNKLGAVLSEEQIQKADETADKLSALNQVMQVQFAGIVANNADAIMVMANALGALANFAGKAASAYRRYKIEQGIWLNENAANGWLTSDEEKAKARANVKMYRAELSKLDRKPGAFGTAGLDRLANRPAGFVGVGEVEHVPAKSGGSKRGSGGTSASARAAAQDTEKLAQAMKKLSVWGGDASKAIGAANDNLVKFSDRAGPALERVVPAFDAAKLKAGEFADKLAELQSRLFPEIDAMAKYRAELDVITRALDQNRISAEQAAEWRHRLAMEGRSTETAISTIMADAGPEVDMDRIGEGLDSLYDRMRGFRDKSGVLTVQVAESFKQMADNTINSLNELANSIKGGGFLDILSAVVGLGLQLGSVGAFGTKIQTNINSAPKRAWGGQINAGQMYMVGERGPEMFVAGNNGHIVPNHRLGGGAGTVNKYYVQGNLLTPEFWQRITQQDAQAAMAGGEIGYQKVVTKGRRRLA